MDTQRPSIAVGREVAHLKAVHFESDLARTIFNDAGRSSKLPERVQRALETRMLSWAQKCSASAVMTWGGRFDAVLVPRLNPAAFRRFCALLVERHPHALESMPHTKSNVMALARAVHVSQHINPPVLQRLLKALKSEGLSRE